LFYLSFETLSLVFGTGAVLLGFAFIIQALRQDIWDKKKIKQAEMICPKCETIYMSLDQPGHKCPHCGVGLEDLKGFYERHPELKK
jgi:Zn finger protein HypA/HybF involved in hydrogenase expression